MKELEWRSSLANNVGSEVIADYHQTRQTPEPIERGYPRLNCRAAR
jgi:hypothetical protein